MGRWEDCETDVANRCRVRGGGFCLIAGWASHPGRDLSCFPRAACSQLEAACVHPLSAWTRQAFSVEVLDVRSCALPILPLAASSRSTWLLTKSGVDILCMRRRGTCSR
jgi:hypothetical protein